MTCPSTVKLILSGLIPLESVEMIVESLITALNELNVVRILPPEGCIESIIGFCVSTTKVSIGTIKPFKPTILTGKMLTWFLPSNRGRSAVKRPVWPSMLVVICSSSFRYTSTDPPPGNKDISSSPVITVDGTDNHFFSTTS